MTLLVEVVAPTMKCFVLLYTQYYHPFTHWYTFFFLQLITYFLNRGYYQLIPFFHTESDEVFLPFNYHQRDFSVYTVVSSCV